MSVKLDREHQPTAKEENDFIARHGMTEYGRWHLGIDDAQDPEKKARYKFLYSDFKKAAKR